ncbi:hypothetical protein RSAG8_09478, partial [Rhizoctonia solani AG-8 WAC10335]
MGNVFTRNSLWSFRKLKVYACHAPRIECVQSVRYEHNARPTRFFGTLILRSANPNATF